MYSAKRRSAKRRGQAGVSLIEALVTMGIMSAGVLGLSASAIELSRVAKWADMNSAATALATKQLEELRSMPLGSPAHAPGNYSAGALQANGTAGGPYTVSWVVSAINKAGTADVEGVKTITVTTSWSQNNENRTVQMGALVRCTKTPCVS
jgi:Tfp pilus assembly protein PilV